MFIFDVLGVFVELNLKVFPFELAFFVLELSGGLFVFLH